ncbi:hypothetical protein JEODO184_01018 [Jeotgalicoccus meleagridis]|uniref:Uncharacterized protein n=1 Tax=Jeotgalicoccus meleagridis TaxID=2759181 RepID=A0A6V7RFJ4_9STAP|nr:hypothetical protein JEODO184_01018 [Jeotgalicoccus meleagridis]
MNILIKCMNSNENHKFFKIIHNIQEERSSVNDFVYECVTNHPDLDENDLIVQLIYPYHSELYTEYHLDYVSR